MCLMIEAGTLLRRVSQDVVEGAVLYEYTDTVLVGHYTGLGKHVRFNVKDVVSVMELDTWCPMVDKRKAEFLKKDESEIERQKWTTLAHMATNYRKIPFVSRNSTVLKGYYVGSKEFLVGDGGELLPRFADGRYLFSRDKETGLIRVTAPPSTQEVTFLFPAVSEYGVFGLEAVVTVSVEGLGVHVYKEQEFPGVPNAVTLPVLYHDEDVQMEDGESAIVKGFWLLDPNTFADVYKASAAMKALWAINSYGNEALKGLQVPESGFVDSVLRFLKEVE